MVEHDPGDPLYTGMTLLEITELCHKVIYVSDDGLWWSWQAGRRRGGRGVTAGIQFWSF